MTTTPRPVPVLKQLIADPGTRLIKISTAGNAGNLAPGFIAALDQSGGSTPKALKLYGVEESAYNGDAEMFDQVHAMRNRIVSSPADR